MASTSTSCIQKSFKYDVFLSFRGEGTPNTFVGHLYEALKQKSIKTYIDDKKIRKGKTISDELIEAIEDSRLYIIVFSKKYASSSWRLEELVKIMECQKMPERTAYPVFYDVRPTEVRELYGPVGEAFKKHKNDESAGNWREALKEAAALAGCELETRHEAYNFIQKIVQDISLELRFIDSSIDGNLVGMEARVNEVISSLETGVDDVRMIGIKGMGGAGKTTLARAVFDKLSFLFEDQSFVENIRERSSLSGLNSLQKQVLSDVLNDQGIIVSGVHEGQKMIKEKMHVRKVLIVLDDVDKIEQLEALVGDRDWFKPGSRIIITTREEQVLAAHKVNLIRDVHLLDDKEAICLFSRHAFRREIPIEGYKELSEQVVRYAAGLPLTIQVLGSFLRDKDNLEWEDAIDRLKMETIEKLKLSYDDLEEEYKEIFLDVACILKGRRKDDAVIVLESCGFPAQKGLTVLELKSLITISEHGELDMHDSIEEMGKNIVRRVNPSKPEMHSRLWIEEEIVDILAKYSGNQATKCIRLNAYGLNFEILMNGLTSMKELRFLDVCNRHVYRGDVSNWNFDEDSLHLPDALRFLSWKSYPFSSLPKTFQANNLVGLEMDDSNIIQLWKDGKVKALKLRFLKFRLSEFRTLDLSVAPNLETLILERCDNLVEGHFQVTPNLKELCIDRCYKLKKLHMPAESPKLKSLNLLENSKLTTLHLGKTPNLETLNLYRCADMVELRMPAESPKLKSLNLEGSKLTTLDLGETPNLETLILQECTRMVKLCMPAECPKLVTLDLYNLELRTLHLGISPNLEKIRLQDSPMVELHMPAECPKLVNLDLSFLRLTTLCLGNTPNLETLKLQRCTEMVELAECPKLVNLNLFDLNLTTPHICQILTKCRKLVNLKLSYLELMTLRLGINPNLEKLSVNNCTDMVELRIATDCPKLVTLNLNYNVKLRTLDLGLTPNLESLDLYDCYDLEEINASAECLKKLIHLNISNCGRFKYFKFDKEAPKDLYQLEYLEELRLRSADIKNLPDSLFMLKHLKSLEINSCRLLEKLPEDIGRLQCLKKLIVKNCKILRDIPNSICEMDHLKCLDLTDCTRIEELPEEIGRLECLKELDIRGTGVTRLPKSIYQLKGLCIKGLHFIDDDDVEDVERGGGDDDDGDGDDYGDDDDCDSDSDNGDNVDDDVGMLMGNLMI